MYIPSTHHWVTPLVEYKIHGLHDGISSCKPWEFAGRLPQNIVMHLGSRLSMGTLFYILWCSTRYGIFHAMVFYKIWCSSYYVVLHTMVFYKLRCSSCYGVLQAKVFFILWCSTSYGVLQAKVFFLLWCSTS